VSSRLVGALAALVCCGGLAAQAVHLATIEGVTVSGKLVGLDTEQRLTVTREDGAAQMLALDAVRELARDDATPAAAPATGLVLLRSGQSLNARITGTRRDANGLVLLFAVPPARTEIALPLRTIRAVRFAEAARADGDGFDAAMRDAATQDRVFAYPRGNQAERIVRRTVEVRSFSVDEADQQLRVVVAIDGREQPALPVRNLYGIVFGQGAAPDPQAGARVTAHVGPGWSFTGLLAELQPDADRCVLRLDEGAELDLPWQHVQRLSVRSDRLVYLSDLEPTAVEQTPALSRKWEWLRDRAPLGDGIVLQGATHRRGLVLVPRTKLTFDLGGRFDWFEAAVGIDDRAAAVADAIVRVRGDGRILFEADHVKRGVPSLPVKVSVQGIRQLVLETDFGESLDVGDHCAFADARVRRER
jgi:hypothetical protein